MTRHGALRLLGELAKRIDQRAVIAGGFVRDLVLGLEPRDLDIYLYVDVDDRPPLWLWEQVDEAFRVAGFTDVKVAAIFDGGQTSTETDFDDRLDCCWKVTAEDGSVQVDLLFFHEPIDEDAGNVLASFDVCLCMAAMRADASLLRAPLFERDLANGTLTVLRASTHADRLALKFADRRVVAIRPGWLLDIIVSWIPVLPRSGLAAAAAGALLDRLAAS